MALTMEEPPHEATHWTSAAMAEQAGVSSSSVQRIWRAHGLQPHRVRQFKLSNDPAFVDKLRDIVGLYVDPRRTRSCSASTRRARSMRGVQAGRPPIYVWEKQSELIRIPTLILCGDEDEACVKPSLFMKPAHPRERPGFLPGSGHGINLEEPDLFNRLCFDFLTAVEQGKR